MSAPVPGSSEEYHSAKRLRRKVRRGEQVSAPAEAPLALDIAREELNAALAGRD